MMKFWLVVYSTCLSSCTAQNPGVYLFLYGLCGKQETYKVGETYINKSLQNSTNLQTAFLAGVFRPVSNTVM